MEQTASSRRPGGLTESATASCSAAPVVASAAITASGYLRKEVIELLKRTLRTGELATACYMSAELIMSASDNSSTHVICVSVVEALCQSLQQDRRKNDVSRKQVAETISHVAAAVRALSPSSSHNTQRGRNRRREQDGGDRDRGGVREAVATAVAAVCHLSRTVRRVSAEVADRKEASACIERQDDALTHQRLLISPDTTATDAKIARAFRGVDLSNGRGKLLRALYEACRDRRIEDAELLVRLVANKPELFAVNHTVNPSTAGPDVVMSELLVCVSAKQRHDVVWCVWRLCLLMCDGRRHELVRDALFLYQVAYRKHARATRSPLLTCALHWVVDAAYVYDASDEGGLERTLRRVHEKLHVVYEDIENGKRHRSLSSTSSSNYDHPTSSSPPVATAPAVAPASPRLSPPPPFSPRATREEAPAPWAPQAPPSRLRSLPPSRCIDEEDTEEQPPPTSVTARDKDEAFKTAFMFFWSPVDYAARLRVQRDVDELREAMAEQQRQHATKTCKLVMRPSHKTAATCHHRKKETGG